MKLAGLREALIMLKLAIVITPIAIILIAAVIETSSVAEGVNIKST